MRRFAGAVLAALLLTPCAGAGPALAARATLVVEADSGAILHADGANLRAFPASTTKMMTVYLVFEALAAGRLSLDEDLPVSETAAGQGGQSLDLRAGTTVKARDALLGTIVESANDAAVVLAERLGGSEAAFADRMTDKAYALGMTRSQFRNASGLNHPDQVVTARDMAILARALLRDFPDRYALFSTRGFTHRGRDYRSVNGFLVNYQGADGIKTGFTCAAGYNLVASAVRDGRRLIAVVLGETSRGERAETVAGIMNASYDAPFPHAARTLADIDPARTGEADPPAAGVISESCASIVAVPGLGKGGWRVELAGTFRGRPQAETAARRLLAMETMLRGGDLTILTRRAGGQPQFLPVFGGLSQAAARDGCLRLRQRGLRCAVFAPGRTVAVAERPAPRAKALPTKTPQTKAVRVKTASAARPTPKPRS